jgi:transposase
VDTLSVAGRHDLTDAQWAVLAPLLPAPKRSGRPSKWTKRQLVDGIRWRVLAGTPWRDVPERYGSWSAVYCAVSPLATRRDLAAAADRVAGVG